MSPPPAARRPAPGHTPPGCRRWPRSCSWRSAQPGAVGPGVDPEPGRAALRRAGRGEVATERLGQPARTGRYARRGRQAARGQRLLQPVATLHRRHRDLATGRLLGDARRGAGQGRRRLRGLRHRQVRDPAPSRRRQRQAAHHLRQGPAPEPGAHGADLVRQPGCRPAGAGQPDRRDPPPPRNATICSRYTPSTPRACGCPAPTAGVGPATARSCRAGRTC
ncbi:Uncharacterised protein [Pseudomonas aeruginosa]|nr:Uncharacterised protein [Pseudomonas aeruginosa]